MIEPQEECPQYDKCNCNKCPLHKDYMKLEVYPSDSQTTCKVKKSIRQRIGQKYNLSNQGLKPQEIKGDRRSAMLKQSNLQFTQEKNLEIDFKGGSIV